MAETIRLTGFVRDWLASRREELNARFRTAQRRFANLDAQVVLALNAELLPPLAGTGEAGANDLLSEVFDLILLHAGRRLLSSEPSAIRSLLAETFPKLRAFLLQEPTGLPAALSNAVENMGVKGGEFARTLAELGARLRTADQVQDAGAVLAWRLGEARLREQALNVAAHLPEAATLAALGLEDWPEAAAPLALAALNGDAWVHPRERIGSETLSRIAQAPREKVVEWMLALAGVVSPAMWNPRGTWGEFAGFGGYFLSPPQLLYPGKLAQRHRFWVRSGATNFRVDADVFGAVCQPDANADYPVQETAKKVWLGTRRDPKAEGSDKPVLYNDGVLALGGTAAQVPALAQAATYALVNGLLAVTHNDSFRVRVFATAGNVI